MHAVILAGGKGTRLRPYTTVLPKPLVPVGDHPILQLVINQLASRGFNRVDISLGYLGELIEAYFSQNPVPSGVELRYYRETKPLGTAGALRMLDAVDDDFLTMNGDVLTTLDYADMLRFHKRSGAALTIATHRRDVQIELGVIESEGGLATAYVEKPALSYEVSMGVYAYAPATLEFIAEGRMDFPDVVHALINADRPVALYPFDGIWYDIGTIADHERATAILDEHPELVPDA